MFGLSLIKFSRPNIKIIDSFIEIKLRFDNQSMIMMKVDSDDINKKIGINKLTTITDKTMNITNSDDSLL